MRRQQGNTIGHNNWYEYIFIIEYININIYLYFLRQSNILINDEIILKNNRRFEVIYN